MRGLLLGVLLLLPATAFAVDQRALLSLSVNSEDRGEAPVLLRDEEIYLRVEDLEAARLVVPLGRRIEVAGDRYVLLSSLAPEITGTFDEERLQVTLVAPAALFRTTVTQLAAQKPEGFRIARDPSAYLNYALQSTDLQPPDVFLETGLRLLGRSLFFATASQTATLGLTRGLTSLSVDDEAQLTRLSLGDTLISTTLLGSSGIFAGVTYRREYGLDPYVISRPDHLLTGSATTPSLAKIYVNGMLVRQESVPAGPFEFHQLTIPSGAREVQIVVRDAFGRETTTSTSAYIVPTLLAPGQHDYTYTAGFPRLPTTQDHPWGLYAPPALVGLHRYGVSDSLTAGARLEAGPNTLSAGPVLTLGHPWGQLDLETAASIQARRGGAAASATYTYAAPRFGVGLSARLVSPRYATSSTPATADRVTLAVGPFASYELTSTWSIGASATTQRTRDNGGMHALRLSSGLGLTKNLSALVTLDYTSQSFGKRDLQGMLMLTYSFGNQLTAQVETHQDARTGPSVSTTVEKSLPVGDGIGYRLRGSYARDGSAAGDGLLQYQGKYGFAEANVTGDQTGTLHHTLHYAGGMAVVNGYAALGRPVDQGFAVVKLEDLPDVHVTVNNAGVGTTNGHGTLLLPSLLPYYGNTVALVTEDIPVDRSLEAITKLAVPPLHGGALVEFRAPRVRGLQGTIHPTVPDLPTDFGPGAISLTVNDKPIEAVVGRHGEFYLEDIPPGDHDLTVEFPNLTCHVHLQVPDTAESLRSLGELPCVPAH